MEYWKVLKNIFRKKVNLVYFFSLSFLLFWLLRIFPHWDILWSFWNLEGVSFSRWFEVFWDKTILIMEISLWSQNLIAFLFPILISLNIIIFKEYYKKQKIVLKSKGFWGSLGGIFFGFFGVGCAACSAIFIAPVISFLGIGWIFTKLPWNGVEIAWIGLSLIIFSIFFLLKKITEPLICSK